ncbi:MAG TPA: enoyl-CoA hydratase-related protein [Chloroflexota bacterium]|jgi:methylglutaconyl-CoA hydratase
MSYVRTRVAGIRGIIEIDRPEGRNALDGDGWRAIAAATRRHEADPGVRTLLLQSTGSVFCAGGDVDWMRRSEAAELAVVADALGALADGAKPVVARVQGPTYGGGVGLAAACDLVVASTQARFQMSEVRLGVAPALVSRAVIGRVGGARFRAWALTARAVGADEAAAAGLVDLVCAPEALEGAIDGICQALCAGEPVALAAVKRLFPAGLDGEAAAAELARLRGREAFAEGIAALREKRPPRWVRGNDGAP